jgi:thiamine biosynthesis lipoprotein
VLSAGRTTGSYRDVIVDRVAETVTLLKPLRLDLGAVAKGLAIDLASAELRNFLGAIVDAGGDIFAQGCDRTLQPWSVAIRDPREHEQAAVQTIALSDAAICTSGDYERRDPTGAGHHILNPVPGHSVDTMSSVSIVAGSAMVADALATAAFVIGSSRAPALLARFGAEGLFLHDDGRCVGTGGFAPRSVRGGSGQRG